MLEVTFRDGRARLAEWKPKEGGTATLPALAFPLTDLAAAPDWIEVTVGLGAGPAGKLHLVSGGTWFHPADAPPSGALLVPPVPTAPTSKVQVVPAGDELAVFHDAGAWATNPKEFLAAHARARAEATPARVLWAPALGTPADYALHCYLGIDLFDASPLLLAAFRGQGLTPDGSVDAAQAGRLAGRPGPLSRDELVAFNLEQARQELERIRHAIAAGTLRRLVERRVHTDARSVETLRRFDREHTFLEAAAPRHRASPLAAMTAESLWMPEVEAFRRTLRSQYEPPPSPRVLVLLPCSQRKPYKTSRSHRQFARVLDDSGIRPLLHEAMITSPLGIVPRELEEVYPANQYDIPVTGHWLRDEEEAVREQLRALLSKGRYERIILHAAPDTCAVLAGELPPNTVRTCLEHPTSRDDLARLAAALADARTSIGPVDLREASRARKLADLRALATFQFGPAVADALTAGAQASGHMPYVKLWDAHGVQLASTTPDRGVLSLTLDGAAILARLGRKRVFIQDFQPRKTSSLFAVGVLGADPDVRVGDEVVVVRDHGDRLEVRGCGVAQMPAEEMGHAKRGIAVTLRHTGTPGIAKPAPRPIEQEAAA